MSDEAAFDLETELTAAGVTVGQLSDDVAAVRDLLGRSHDDVAVWHDLRHLIGVLSASQRRIDLTERRCRSRVVALGGGNVE